MVVSRFAPSPTGDLHIGSVRTALYAWLFARQQHGKFILRIEDTDLDRSTLESVQVILDGMNWLGLNYEIGPIYQSERFERYRQVANTLIETGYAYKCYCSKERLDLVREKQMADGHKPKYDGYCRLHAIDSKESENLPYVIRFATPQSGEVHYIDRIRGELKVCNSELDDLVIIRQNGTPTYNFAVVVDDSDMDVSMVIRGDDHINNTFRQVNLFIALGIKPPQFAHVSAILGSDGKKLSKRHGATNVLAYQKEGILPEALLNALVRLGWSHGDQEIFSVEEMIHLFRIDDVHKSPAIFDPQKLIWFNQHYLKHLDNAKIIKYVMPFLDESKLDLNNTNKPNKPKLEKVVELFKPRAKNLKELADKVAEFYLDEIKYDPAATDKFFTANSLDVLNKVLLKIQDLKDSEWTAEALHKHLNDLVAETGLKFPDVAQPIRVALLGHTNSPSINETMAVLSKNIVITRLDNAIKFIKSK